MKKPQFTIRSLMIVVALVAVATYSMRYSLPFDQLPLLVSAIALCHRGSETKGGVPTRDLRVFAAGLAGGWLMHQISPLRIEQHDDLLLWRRNFESLLGTVWIGWLWALLTGLAFLVVSCPLRYGSRDRPAEWLAVVLAIVLFESIYPPLRMKLPGQIHARFDWATKSDQVQFDAQYLFEGRLYPANLASDRPLTFELWWSQQDENWEKLWWTALPMIVAAAIVGITAWCLRARISSRWLNFVVTVIAVLIALGPMQSCLARGWS
jgi:hypothetical protein